MPSSTVPALQLTLDILDNTGNAELGFFIIYIHYYVRTILFYM